MKRFLQRRRDRAQDRRAARVPDDRLVYAIGDVHGRLDLLETLMCDILEDAAHSHAERRFVVLLGDLVDRGPASREVIAYLMAVEWRGIEPIFLLGNHEEAMLGAYHGSRTTLSNWLSFGGAETLVSYGFSQLELLTGQEDHILDLMHQRIPRSHIAFLEAFYDCFEVGDYFFSHAGVRPGVPLDRQTGTDLRWIRSEFLNSKADFGKVVVHGHTISTLPEERANRIGIDTGAYLSDRLTAIRLEGMQRRLMSTVAD